MSATIKHIGSLSSRGGIRSVSGFSSGAVAPTVLQLTSPNDFTHSSWGSAGQINCNRAYGLTAPDFTSTASEIVSTSSGFAAARTTIPITMASNTHYSLTGYIKNNVVGPVWMKVLFNDSVAVSANFIAFYINATSGAGAAGTGNAVAGGGVIDSITVTAAGNNYTKAVLVFHFTSTPGSDATVELQFTDSDGGSSPTVSQDFFVWGWGA